MMNSVLKRAAALGLSALLASTALAGCGSEKESSSAIDGTATLMTVNDEKVPLGVAAFYARYQQAQLYQLYQMYFGSASSIFSQSYDESGTTYGDEMKEEMLTNLKTMMVIRQHAEDYDISISDSEEKAIEKAAQQYIDSNDEETRKKVGASKEDAVEAMELQTYQSKMMDPIVADVDTKVTDKEAQQTTLTYVSVAVPDSLPTDSGAESAVTSSADGAESVLSGSSAAESLTTDSYAADSVAASATESVSAADVTLSGTESAAAESGASSGLSGAESVESAAEEPDPALQAYAEAKAQKVLDAAEKETDTANADLDAVAKSVDKDLAASNGQFTTNDTSDTTLDSSLVKAVSGLSDGTLVDHVVKSSDGKSFYVVRLDKNFDKDATETKKQNIVVERKQNKFKEVTDGWVNEAKIKVDDDVWATFTISDEEPFTLVTPEASQSAAESAVSSAVSGTSVNGAETPADEAASAAASAAETAATTAETAASPVSVPAASSEADS
ncbi:MAG: hypothetical protein MR671_09460 [Clostridiales bacterium]|nr:hypothetical protein [Clostridiales bacterium]